MNAEDFTTYPSNLALEVQPLDLENFLVILTNWRIHRENEINQVWDGPDGNLNSFRRIAPAQFYQRLHFID
jgi:hypothetical protein